MKKVVINVVVVLSVFIVTAFFADNVLRLNNQTPLFAIAATVIVVFLWRRIASKVGL